MLMEHINTYLICINSFVHCPRGHEEVNGSCSERGRELVQFTELLHVVDNRVILGGVLLCLLKNGGDLAKNQGEQNR